MEFTDIYKQLETNRVNKAIELNKEIDELFENEEVDKEKLQQLYYKQLVNSFHFNSGVPHNNRNNIQF